MEKDIINPFEQMMKSDKERKRRICFYGRVSTEHEEQLDALDNQLKWYDDQLNNHKNWVLHKKYIDKGITGTQAHKRPAFLEMIEDAKKGEFDLIVTREVSRFARNTVDTLEYTRKLKYEYNVEVYFVLDNIWTFDGDGELRLTIMATLAQDESRKISERVRAGQKMSRAKGVLYGSGNILGYDRIGDHYVINEEQAETVRFIFRCYAQGMTMTQIKYALIEKGYKTASDGKWCTTAISRILHRSTYCGVQAYGQSYSTGYLDQKRFNNKDRETYIYKDLDTIPPIITKEEYEKVQEIVNARKKENTNFKDNRHVFIGKKEKKDIWLKKLKCGCGSSTRKEHWEKTLSGDKVVHRYSYRCYNQVNNGSIKNRLNRGLPIDGCCDIKSSLEWKLELMAKDVMRKLWETKRDVVDLACKIIEENYDAPVNNEKLVQTLGDKLEKLNNKKLALISMRADGEIGKTDFAMMKKKVEGEIAETKAKINELSAAVVPDESDKEGRLSKIRDFLNELVDFDKETISREILDKYIYQVVHESDNRYIWFVNSGRCSTEGEKRIAVEHFMDQTAKYSKKLMLSKRPTGADVKIHSEKVPTMSNNSTGSYCSKWGEITLPLKISKEKANEYRKHYGTTSYIKQWNDLEVCIVLL